MMLSADALATRCLVLAERICLHGHYGMPGTNAPTTEYLVLNSCMVLPEQPCSDLQVYSSPSPGPATRRQLSGLPANGPATRCPVLS
eukprot:3170587-Rhodomonas_salina.3